jgi:hypothetical protein
MGRQGGIPEICLSSTQYVRETPRVFSGPNATAWPGEMVAEWCKIASVSMDSMQLEFTEQMMNQTQKTRNYSQLSKTAAGISLFLLTLILAPLAMAKMNVDFDPSLDFSKFKTFAYVGGVNTLEFRQLNPNMISDRVHAGVAQALTERGLKEVKPDQQPDLVVRYWANSQSQVVSPSAGTWGQFGAYVSDYWAYTYDLMKSETSLDATLVIDLIDLKRKDLAWRLYLEQKIVDDDSIWNKVLGEISKGFKSYPPSKKEMEEKRKERAEHPPKPAAQ